jgi:hypothetical protein
VYLSAKEETTYKFNIRLLPSHFQNSDSLKTKTDSYSGYLIKMILYRYMATVN